MLHAAAFGLNPTVHHNIFEKMRATCNSRAQRAVPSSQILQVDCTQNTPPFLERCAARPSQRENIVASCSETNESESSPTLSVHSAHAHRAALMGETFPIHSTQQCRSRFSYRARMVASSIISGSNDSTPEKIQVGP